MWTSEEAEDARFLLATLESFHTGRVTPLLKEELRCKIQSRRLSEGKAELDVSLGGADSDDKDCSLRPDEIEKNERRKAQNRRAAAKFRRKQKSLLSEQETLVIALKKRKAELMKEVADMEYQRDILRKQVISVLNMNSPSIPATQ